MYYVHISIFFVYHTKFKTLSTDLDIQHMNQTILTYKVYWSLAYSGLNTSAVPSRRQSDIGTSSCGAQESVILPMNNKETIKQTKCYPYDVPACINCETYKSRVIKFIIQLSSLCSKLCMYNLRAKGNPKFA